MHGNLHPFIPVLSPSFLYHPYIPSFKSKDFSFIYLYIYILQECTYVAELWNVKWYMVFLPALVYMTTCPLNLACVLTDKKLNLASKPGLLPQFRTQLRVPTIKRVGGKTEGEGLDDFRTWCVPWLTFFDVTILCVNVNMPQTLTFTIK